ncbi:MAG: hypothetical protein ABI433_00600 [Burkholderiaceae bacterium]
MTVRPIATPRLRNDRATLRAAARNVVHLGFALYTDQTQKVTMATELSGDIAIDPNGTWPTRVTVNAGNVQWEFLPDPRGSRPHRLPTRLPVVI